MIWAAYPLIILVVLLALSPWITRWLGPSVDERLRDSQRLIRESHDAAARIQARAERHGPHFKD